MTTPFAFNSSLLQSSSFSKLYCPLLQEMRSHSLNNDTRVNLVAVSVLGALSSLGILENALVLWVLGFRLRRKTVAAVWVINLALSDFLATLTLPLFTHYLMRRHSWDLGQPLCSAQASIFFLNMFVSAFLLAAISLDRCLLVAKPVWSQNRRSVAAAWKVCAIGWLWATVNAFPYFLFRSVTIKEDQRNLCYHDFALYSSPNTLQRDCKVRQAATAVTKALLAFVVPLVVIAISYVHLSVHLQARRKRRQSHQLGITSEDKTLRSLSIASQSSGVRGERLSSSFTKMVASIITTFALCWAPYHFFCLLEVVAQYMPEKIGLVEQGLPLSTIFAFLNSVLNPVIYTFSCPHFCTRIRQSLGDLFEGLVEEAVPLVLSSGRRKKSDLNSPTSPISISSPNTPTFPRSHLVSEGSIHPFNFQKCPQEEKERTVD